MVRKTLLLALLGALLGLATFVTGHSAEADDQQMTGDNTVSESVVTVTLLRWPYT